MMSQFLEHYHEYCSLTSLLRLLLLRREETISSESLHRVTELVQDASMNVMRIITKWQSKIQAISESFCSTVVDRDVLNCAASLAHNCETDENLEASSNARVLVLERKVLNGSVVLSSLEHAMEILTSSHGKLVSF